MSEPTTTAGKRLLAQFRSDAARRRLDYPVHWLDAADIHAIEAEATAAERERLVTEGWHEPRPDCGPIKAQLHEHTYAWVSSGNDPTLIPSGTPCIGCGHRYGDPEPAP